MQQVEKLQLINKPKKERELSSQAVLAYMTENAGTKYQMSDLAKAFRCTTIDVREEVIALGEQIRSTVIGRHRYFYIPDAAQLSAERRTVQKMRSKKVYVPPTGNRARCRELYPEGHRFITMGGGSKDGV